MIQVTLFGFIIEYIENKNKINIQNVRKNLRKDKMKDMMIRFFIDLIGKNTIKYVKKYSFVKK